MKIWGQSACLRVSRLLNWGIFTGCALKIRNTQNFFLNIKLPYFIQISSIALFNSFLIAWLWGYFTFSDSSVVSLRWSPWLSLKFIRFLRVVFSSQQRLNRPAVNAVQWRHSLPENRVVILIGWLSKHSYNYV